jgi:hypothetical protein
MQWLRTLVTDPDSDPGVVEDLTDIMRMDTIDYEGNNARTVLAICWSDDTNPGAFRETGEQHSSKCILMGRHSRHAHTSQVVAGRGQAHGLGHHRDTRFKPLRRSSVGRALHVDGLNHRPPGQERRHGSQKLIPAP